MPIVFDKTIKLMKDKGISAYRIRKDKVIGMETLRKIQENDGYIDTRSIEKLCDYLDCQPGDLMEYKRIDK